MSTQQQSLKLFEPAVRPTLLELAIASWMQARKKRTWENDLYCLRKWDAKFPGLAAAEITVDHCRQFYRWLLGEVKREAMSSDNANKIARGVNFYLQLIAPDDGSFDPDDPTEVLIPQPLLERVVRVKLVPCEDPEEAETDITLEESGLFLAAAAHAKWEGVNNRRLWPRRPPRLAAARWWHEMWLFIYNTALRIEEALKVEARDLEKDAFGRYLVVRREVAKTGRLRKVRLNEWAAAAVDVLVAQGGKTILDWQLSHNRLDKERRRVFHRAGLDRLLDEGIGFHGLRAACATELAALDSRTTDVSSAEIASKHLGHRAKGVTSKSYVKRRALVAHLARLPQPELQELPAAIHFTDDPQLMFAEFDFL